MKSLLNTTRYFQRAQANLLLVLLAIGQVLFMLGCDSKPTDWTLVIEDPRIDDDGDGVDDGLEAHLIWKYGPVVYLDSQESHYPADVDWYLKRCELRFYHDGGCPDHTVVPRGELTQAKLVKAEHYASKSLITFPPWDSCEHQGSPDNRRRSITSAGFYLESTASAKKGRDNPYDWVVYCHVRPTMHDAAPGGYDIQYFFFYPFNEAPGAFNTPVFSDLTDHDADWEHVTITVDSRLEFHSVYMARHGGGERYDKEHPSLDFYDDNRVVVYSARGTHGSYPTEGRFGLAHLDLKVIGIDGAYDITSKGTQWHTYRAFVNLGEIGRPLHDQVFTAYAGLWGGLGDSVETYTFLGAIPGLLVPAVGATISTFVLLTQTELDQAPIGPTFKTGWDSPEK